MFSQTLSVPYIQLPKISNWKETIYDSGYTLASYCTDPLCTALRWYWQGSISETLYPTTSKVEQWVKKSLFFTGAVASGVGSIITTPCGILLRYFLISMQSKPFLYAQGDATEQELGKEFSLLSWNLCCVPAHYSITDGGVLPWMFRIQKLISAIKNQETDIVCLYEIFDIQTAHILIEGLKTEYRHFYYNIGPNAIGLPSGLFVASKAKIVKPDFIAFPQTALDGRAKYSKKGVFSFVIVQSGVKIVRIFTTHLQHSEIPACPTLGELKARQKQISIIVKKICEEAAIATILTGDFNLDDKEYIQSNKLSNFDKGKIEGSGFTWGGDKWCASLTGKRISAGLNLDHSIVLKNKKASITTSFVQTHFESDRFKSEALSDHKGLKSAIKFI